MLGYLKFIVSIGFIVLGVGVASSQEYPTRPVRIYVGVAGGGADIGARMIAQGITGPLGQSVIVENRSGSVAEQTVAKATPDGYSLVLTDNSVILGPLLEQMDFDAMRDLSPVIMTSRNPNVVIVHPHCL